MTHVLIVGGWTENYEAALELGYEVSGFAALHQRSLISDEVLGRCGFWDVDSSDAPQALHFAKKLHAEHPIHGVFSFTERGLETAAVIASALSIPGNELDTNVRTRNKQLTRSAVKGTALDNVAWRVAYNQNDVLTFFAENGPCVIKPMSGVGSEGVSVIFDAATLASDVARRTFPALVEAYIDGAEFSVETLSLGGHHEVLTVTHKTLTENLVEMQHLMPAPISAHEREILENAVVMLLNALDVSNSVAHSEFRLRRDAAGELRVYLIETQLRPGGGRIWKLLEICRGVNVFAALMRGTVERRADFPPLTPERHCLAYFPRFEQGVVERIDGVERLSASAGVELVDLEIKVGSPTHAYVSSATRNGSVLVSADSHDELLVRRDAALAHLHVSVAGVK